jgi:iron complex outermembrane receptor protein
MQTFQLNGITGELKNAAKSTIKGVEGEIAWIATDGLALGFNADYIVGKYKEFLSSEEPRPQLGIQDLSGNRLPLSPRYHIRLDANYHWQMYEGRMTLRGDATWAGRIYYTPFNRRETSSAPSAEFNAYATFERDDWTFAVYGRNLTNERKVIFADVSAGLFGFPAHGAVAPPRTYGMSVTKRW